MFGAPPDNILLLPWNRTVKLESLVVLWLFIFPLTLGKANIVGGKGGVVGIGDGFLRSLML